MKKYLLIAVSSIFFLALLFVALEYFVWPNPVGLRLSAAIGLPAVRINQTTFSVADLLADQKSINTVEETKGLTTDQKNTIIVEKLKQEGTITSIIKELKLEIKDSDIATLQANLLRGANDQTLSEQEVQKTFGYSIADFTRRVVVPYYNRLQLQKYYIFNTANADRDKISQLREQLTKEPKSFDTEATKITGQDPVEHIVLKTDLTGDYEHILSVPVGGISAIVANADGYRLFQVKSIIEDDAKGTYYQLHELFIPTTIFQEKLNEALAKASEHWYIKKPPTVAAK